MGLGNFDIASFKPKRSETAASLLTVAPQQDAKKTERLELRIRSDVLMLFKDICKEQNTDASKALRAYIDDTVSSGTMTNKTAFSDLSVQSVRTNENGPIPLFLVNLTFKSEYYKCNDADNYQSRNHAYKSY